MAHGGLELALQRIHLLADARALFGGKALEDVGRNDFAVPERSERQSHRGPLEGDPFLLRLALERAERFFVAVLELLVDYLAAGAIVLAFERGGQHGAQLADQLLLHLPQRDGAPGWHFAQARRVWIGEIVYVAPIGRRLLLRSLVGEQVPGPVYAARCRRGRRRRC